MKPWFVSIRRVISYMLREQRLLFVLVGIAIATLAFTFPGLMARGDNVIVVEPILLEVDQIYHLACPASPVHYKFNPVKTIKTNEACGSESTSEVYGDPLQHPQVVQETIDPNAKIEFRPNTEDDPHKRKPDITKAKELLGWEPKVALRQGLPLMVKDFRQRVFGDQKQEETTTSSSSTE
ncbi:hypothetical protein HID58_052535 [Brassica napus]|uniref:UDP-glucuronate decarboxylase n=1 Tax=Brassica napus TaxID=3708 RepID=A0ABQ8ADA6_BRANA|nr:hypothetical protein HID58_052535 [Brassica napus]